MPVATVRERSGRREQNKAENRAALLRAARTVFAEMGFGAAGVRDIVRRTDLASGTFYNYFKDKDEIFEAVVAEMTAEILRRPGGLCRPPGGDADTGCGAGARSPAPHLSVTLRES